MPLGNHTPWVSVPHLESEAVAKGPSPASAFSWAICPVPLPWPGHTFLALEAREQWSVISWRPCVTLPGDVLRRPPFFPTCLGQPFSPAPFSGTSVPLKPTFRLLFPPSAHISRTYSSQRVSSVTVPALGVHIASPNPRPSH